MPEQDKMALWLAVCETNPNHTKNVSQRGGFTAICAQSQIMRATELWGPYGSTWGVRNCHWEYVRDGKGEIVELALCADFWYPGGEFPLSADAAYRAGNDSRKKVCTDLTTKALSKLGFNADVFLGLYDDNKYVNEMKEKHAEPEKPTPEVAAWNKTVVAFGYDKTNAAWEQNFAGQNLTLENVRALYGALQAAAKIEGEPADG